MLQWIATVKCLSISSQAAALKYIGLSEVLIADVTFDEVPIWDDAFSTGGSFFETTLVIAPSAIPLNLLNVLKLSFLQVNL